MSTIKVIIAASGTGGHLFPALHIARALQANADVHIEFIGSGRALEAEIIDRAGFLRHVVRMVGVRRRGLHGVGELCTVLPRAARQVWKIVSTVKPDIVIGVGGYASVLPVLIARMRGIPTWIHEAELKPGLANWVLAWVSTKISLAFSAATLPRRSKAVVTGHPVWPGIATILPRLRPGESPQRILVLGGSQGAAGIDRAMISLAPELAARGIQLRHQARKEGVEGLKEAYERAGLQATVEPFIRDMVEAYQWADIVVSRSGAGTVMELGVANIPAILIPYPAPGIHQGLNAEVLGAQGKALVVNEGEGFEERLRSALTGLLEPDQYHAMRSRPCEQRQLDAASSIARGCLALIR